jgi:SHS2 domain-containing protein
MGKFNLSEAAKDILNASVASKRGGQDSPKKLDASVAYGEKEAGLVGNSPEKKDDELPDYLKGTPSAKPPGATPPVGSEKDGVGFSKPKNQPQETQGRADLVNTQQASANEYEKIRDRVASPLAPQTFEKNPGATFTQYEDIDLSADVNALLEGESLSEEFKQKATTIFEAAVNTRLKTIQEQMESELVEQFEGAIEKVKEELTEKVDDYLNYMVEQWMQDNELAIENGLRSEIVEEFISKLRNLFVESYIDIPEDKVDVIGELTEKIEDLETKLDEEIKNNIQYTKVINEQKKVQAVLEACEGLTQTQVEKLKSLAESVEYTTDEEFTEKLSTLKGNYFPDTKVKVSSVDTLNEEVQIEEDDSVKQTKSADPMMDQYAKTISKTKVR